MTSPLSSSHLHHKGAVSALRGWTAESLDNSGEKVIMIIRRECSAPQEGCIQPLGIEGFQLRLVLKEKLTIPRWGKVQ